jgi:hypothetical protein
MAPVRRHREAAGKYLIFMALSKMTGSNLGAETMIRPVSPLLQGSGEIAGEPRVPARSGARLRQRAS